SYYVTIGIGEVNDRWTLNFGIVDDTGTAAPVPTSTPTPKPVAPQPPAPQRNQVAPTPTPPPPPPTEMALSAGINRVVFRGPAGYSVDLFDSLVERLEFVYTWDEANGRWLRYVPGMPAYVNSLAWMEPGEYIISVTSAVTWD